LDSITSNKFLLDNNFITILVRDDTFNYKVSDWLSKYLRTKLGGYYLEYSNHKIAQSLSIIPKLEDFSSNIRDLEPKSESDAENL
jgi:hypothetical protein